MLELSCFCLSYCSSSPVSFKAVLSYFLVSLHLIEFWFLGFEFISCLPLQMKRRRGEKSGEEGARRGKEGKGREGRRE